MDTTLTAILSFYAFSTGRRMFALQQVAKEATAAGHAALAAHCDAALDHDRGTRDLEARWAGQTSESQYTPEARQLDLLVDAALVALRDGVDSAARASEPGDPLGEAAVELGKLLFPTSVADIIKLPYIDELGQVARIVALLGSQEWSPKVKELGLARQAAYLSGLEKKYRVAVQTPGKVAFADVKAARARGQSLMLQAVAMVLGLYPSDSAADQAARAKLLGPVFVQNDAIREYLRTRRAIVDIHPDTGEEQSSTAQTGTEGAPVA